MNLLAWLGLTAPPDPVTVATHEWIAADAEARAEVSAREQLAAAQCREAAARYELRERNRMYGRASQTIGAQRGMLARVRAHRDELDDLLEHVAIALGCGPDPTAAWFRDVAARAGAFLAADGETVLRDLRAAGVVRPIDEQRAADEALVEAMQRHPSGTDVDPADTAKVGDDDPTLDYDDPTCCKARQESWGCTRSEGHRGQHVAGGGKVHAVWPNQADADDAALVAKAEHLGDEIGPGRETAIEGAAITLRAHVYSPMHRDTACCCGWDAVQGNHSHTAPQGEAREAMHARHVAEQLAAVGALGGTIARATALRADVHQERADRLAIDLMRLRDHAADLIRRDREFENGPIGEHPAPRPAVRTGSFRLGPARNLADGTE